jgi:hypothetical protein
MTDKSKRPSITKLLRLRVYHRLVLVGLSIVIVSNVFKLTVLKISVDEALAELGVVLFVIGGIHWLFESSLREHLVHEIAALTIKNVSVRASGLSDIVDSSREVDYSDDIRRSGVLTVGLNYRPRILEDYDWRLRVRRISSSGLNGLTETPVPISRRSQRDTTSPP